VVNTDDGKRMAVLRALPRRVMDAISALWVLLAKANAMPACMHR